MSLTVAAQALVAAAALALLPAAQAHMTMFHPSVYGFNRGDSNVQPLSGQSFNNWWFHGNIDDAPSETLRLNPGQSVNIEIACSIAFTSWGGQSSSDACPADAGSYHAGGSTGDGSGWGGNQDSNLAGCALAIAYKSDAYSVRPEDFIVMSVQENCVRQRDTSFDLPSNLPACPEGGCTCAWFWQGKNSADEMYMTGFKCDVNGGAVGANIPQPAAPRRNNINGPTQPIYWANDASNIDGNIGWDSKPAYNAGWGWTNGAQNQAFGGAGGSPAPTRSSGDGDSASSSSSSRGSQRTGGRWQQGQGGQGNGDWQQGQDGQGQGNGGNPDWNNYAAAPTSSGSDAAPTGNAGSGSGNGDGNGSGDRSPCHKVRRRRRSRTRRAAHYAQNAASH